MKNLLFTLIAVGLTTFCFGQSDTIYSNNLKIACAVKEITPEAVKFTYPGEDVVNSFYKNTVQKIVFKSGRVQTFAEATSFKTVAGANDFENVTISQVQGEVSGLFKLGEVSAKAKGTTAFANQERVKERAYRKLKIQAAMMGGNIVYLIDQRTQGNKFGTNYQAAETAETNLTGVAYTNQLPAYDDFVKFIGDKRNLVTVAAVKLWSSASDLSYIAAYKKFAINSITNDNGLIMLDGKLEDEKNYTKFRVVSFSNEYFVIYYEDKSTAYNLTISL